CSSGSATDSTSPSGPTAGWLTVQLNSPRTDDGAVQLAITGPRIDSVKLVNYDGFNTTTGTSVNLVVTGSISNGDLARIYVPDVSRTTEYQASVSAAAARDTYALQDLSGYRAILVR